MTKMTMVELDLDEETYKWLIDTATEKNASIDDIIHDTLILQFRHDFGVEKYTMCKVHPNYMAIREPKSKKPNCTCKEVWRLKKLISEKLKVLDEPDYSY